jgi:Protein of unknown function (DUF3040)
MRFAGSQGRALDRMERTLLADDPRLGSLFAVFTTLTRQEPMPATEQVRTERWRLPRAAVTVLIALVILAGVFTLASSTPNGQTCGVTVTLSVRSYSVSQVPRCPALRQQRRYRR